MQACVNCKYYYDYGDCRRHAPTIKPCGCVRMGLYPSTNPNKWCGDWELMEKENKDEQ